MKPNPSTLALCSALAALLIGCLDESAQLGEDQLEIGEENSTNFPGPNAARKGVAKLDYRNGGRCSGTVVKRDKNLHVITAGHCGIPTKAQRATAFMTNVRNGAGAMAYLNLVDGKRSMPDDTKDIDITCTGANPVTFVAGNPVTGNSRPAIANAAAATGANIQACFDNWLNGAEAQLSAVKAYSLMVHLKANNGAALTVRRIETINKAAVARWGDYEVLYPPDNKVCVPNGANFAVNDAATLASAEWNAAANATLTGRRSVSYPRYDEYKAWRIAMFGETDAEATTASDAAFLATWGVGWGPVKATLRVQLFNQTTDICRGTGVDQADPSALAACAFASLLGEQINEKAFGGWTKNRGSAETSQGAIAGGDSGGGGFHADLLKTVNSYGRSPMRTTTGGSTGVSIVWEGLIADLEKGAANQKDWGLPQGGVTIDTSLGTLRPDGTLLADSNERRLVATDVVTVPAPLPYPDDDVEGCAPDYQCMRMNDYGYLEPCITTPPPPPPPVIEPPVIEPPVIEPPVPPTEPPMPPVPPTEPPAPPAPPAPPVSEPTPLPTKTIIHLPE